jgi:hypothetical protein
MDTPEGRILGFHQDDMAFYSQQQLCRPFNSEPALFPLTGKRVTPLGASVDLIAFKFKH